MSESMGSKPISFHDIFVKLLNVSILLFLTLGLEQKNFYFSS